MTTTAPAPIETKKNGKPTALAEPPPNRILLVDQIDRSPSNPRKTFDPRGIEELGAEIKQHGLIHAVLVRPKGERYELVVGERRWRASIAAKLPTIVAVVREMSDAEVLELQVVENKDREDVHPLEQAAALNELHTKHGQSADEIAAKLGKSRAWVYGQLKLVGLTEKARAAFVAGSLSPAVALRVARVPVQLQDELVGELVDDSVDGLPTDSEARDIIRRRYMLRLADAPFNRGDATLVEVAGACTKCPKRTGNQKELFADAESADICTDPTCFAAKKDAHWLRVKAEAEAKGQKVLDEKEAKKLFAYGDTVAHGADFVALDEKTWIDGKETTHRAALGKKAPPPTLTRTPSGAVVELVAKVDVIKLLPKAPAARVAEAKREGKKSEAERAVAVAGLRLAIGAIVGAVERKGITSKLWPLLIDALLELAPFGAGGEMVEGAALRRGLIASDEEDGAAALKKEVAKMGDAEAQGLFVELLLDDDGTRLRGEASAPMKAIAAALKVDLKQCAAKARAAAKADAKVIAETTARVAKSKLTKSEKTEAVEGAVIRAAGKRAKIATAKPLVKAKPKAAKKPAPKKPAKAKKKGGRRG